MPPKQTAYVSQTYFEKLYQTLKAEMNVRVAKLESEMVFHMNNCKNIKAFADEEFPPQKEVFLRGQTTCEMVMHKFEIIIAKMSKQKKLRQVFAVFK